ncbi:MAG: DUF975 family protein [Patescibacteria group bacterium]
MEKPKVEIGPAIGYGWASVKKDFWYLVGLALVSAVISSLANSRDHHPDGWGLLGIFLSTWMTCGQLKMMLSYQAGNKLPFADLFTQFKYFWRVLGATILVGLWIVVGLLLLIVPGIYLALRYQFTLQLIIDKNLGITEAMKQSQALTKGIKMSLLGFDLACLGVIILGAIVFGVGVFVAMPVVWLAMVALYRKLSSAQPSQNQPAA